MSRVSPNEIEHILDAVVGCLTPYGDVCMDAEIQENIPRFKAVCDWVFKRLCYADININSPYHSARRTAEMLEQAADDLASLFASRN